MGKNEKASEAKAETPKRKMLTPKERIAKLEADLAAARKKEQEKADKKANELKAKRAKLQERRDALSDQIKAITAEIGDEPPVAGSTDESEHLAREGKA